MLYHIQNKNLSKTIYWGLMVLYCICSQTAFSQQNYDTLKAVDIRSFNSKLNEIGTKILTYDSSFKKLQNNKDLSELLNSLASVYIRNYGNGSIASIAFRGTGAEHTNIIWNGFQFNNPALGLSDFSGLPVQNNEQITVMAGGNSSSAGSGAIGGSILIDQTHESTNEIQSQINMNNIGGYQFSAGGRYNNKKTNTTFNISKRSDFNHYQYINNYKAGNPLESIPESYSLKTTLNGSFLYKINENTYIKYVGLYNDYSLLIQPPMGITQSTGSRNGFNLIQGIHFNHKSKWGLTQIKTGYIAQNETYIQLNSGNEKSITQLSQIQNMLEHHFALIKQHHKISILFEHQNLHAVTNNYQMPITEHRIASMIQYKYIHKKFQLNSQIRYQFYQINKPFWSPYIGINYLLWSRAKSLITLKSNMSHGFRLPTFNERYYYPGGNINLLPETSNQWEASILYKSCTHRINHEFELTYYYNYMYNRVVWVNKNASIVEPKNLRESQIKGIEYSYQIYGKAKEILYKLQITGAHQFSMNIDPGNTATDHKQMIYIPQFKAQLFFKMIYRHWSLFLTNSYTGKRYTNLNNTSFLEAYWIQNIQIQWSHEYKKSSYSILGKIYNIGNVNFQTQENYAMPRRYFETTILYHIKQK